MHGCGTIKKGIYSHLFQNVVLKCGIVYIYLYSGCLGNGLEFSIFPCFFYTNSTDLVCGATILCRCHKHLCFSYFMLSLFPLFLLFSSSLSLSFALTLIYYNTQTA